MEVRRTIDLGDGHSIEVGTPTWDDSGTQTSIRSRYPTANGGFSPRSSSEIPLGDVRHIAIAAADDDLLSQQEIAEIMRALSESLLRSATS
nr:putative integron gene cassette protein [uncultured bacterium]